MEFIEVAVTSPNKELELVLSLDSKDKFLDTSALHQAVKHRPINLPHDYDIEYFV